MVELPECASPRSGPGCLLWYIRLGAELKCIHIFFMYFPYELCMFPMSYVCSLCIHIFFMYFPYELCMFPMYTYAALTAALAAFRRPVVLTASYEYVYIF